MEKEKRRILGAASVGETESTTVAAVGFLIRSQRQNDLQRWHEGAYCCPVALAVRALYYTKLETGNTRLFCTVGERFALKAYKRELYFQLVRVAILSSLYF